MAGIGSFPIPAGARVVENASFNGGSVVVITSVTPATVLNFYEVKLPEVGYAITANSSLTTSSGPEVSLVFSGHGHDGNVVSGANVPTTGLDLTGLRPGHFAIISFLPK